MKSKLFKSWRMWIYIFAVVLTILIINPHPWNTGVTIRNVEQNSSAYGAGMQSPEPTTVPMSRERIVEINNQEIKTVQEYENIINSLPYNATATFTTKTRRLGILQDESDYRIVFRGADQLGLKVYDAPKSNIILGLDLQGGTRVVLAPEDQLSDEDMELLLTNIEQRINVFGLSDTIITARNDLEGNQFIVVEVAGANEDDVINLLEQQGVFEAKIGNETVFTGGEDIVYVCRTAQCAGIDPTVGCQDVAGEVSCRFQFAISLSLEAAQRQADITRDIRVVSNEFGQAYLEKPLDLYLDGQLVDTLQIGSELRGNPVTDISISGSGQGRTRTEAIQNTNDNMKELQTLLITGSLPTKLEIIKTDTLSPQLGREFLRNAILIALLSELAVTAIVIARYRRFRIAFPIITIISSEILLILGIAAMLKQSIDISGIAGIIVAIGTGVDDQIVITDEILAQPKDKKRWVSWKLRIKKAFFIVFAAYFATIAAMIPLWFAGAGILRGFAITTIIGVTIGVLVTRPAFAHMMKIAVKE